MASVEQAFEQINTAVDNLTNGYADLVSREASHIQAIINAHPAVSVDAAPIVNRLNALADKMRTENFETIAQNDPNLAATVGISANTGTGDTGTGGNSAENTGNEPANAESGGTAPSQIGVSDSDNPLSSMTPNPLGTQPIIPIQNQAPTDAVLQNLQSSGQSPSSGTGAAGASNSVGQDSAVTNPENATSTEPASNEQPTADESGTSEDSSTLSGESDAKPGTGKTTSGQS